MSFVVAAIVTTALAGGDYQGTGDGPAACPGCRNDVKLHVADDGGSLIAGSIVEVGVICPPGDPAGPGGGRLEPPRGTPIRRDGSFGWGNVRGSFAADGRSVSGTVTASCTPEPARFSARLVARRPSRQDRARHCDPLITRRMTLEVVQLRAGCTEATRVSDRWAASRRCLSGGLDIRSCVVTGDRCERVRGGRLDRLAGAACLAGPSRIELVLRRRCPPPSFEYVLFAVNLSCRLAEPVASAWAGRRRQCRDKACHVAGWRCRPLHGPGSTARCMRRGLRHVAIELEPSLIE